ncbi:MAG TPA: TrmH family RNA methyltransferase [Chitinophagales bacterium]|nr:TrmH family RNA methyltransferase [Chitinophagales bacterium]HNL83861.1 TrmH family RNA methyltransferase [Chitinophagales bacterium]
MRKLKLDELNRISKDAFKQAEKLPIIVVLDNVRSAMNIGSVFRSADAFLIQSIYLVGITATPPNREILKTALGATETVDWKYFPTAEACINELDKYEVDLIAIEQSDDSVYLQDFIWQIGKKYALVFGNEVDGVSDVFMENCLQCVEIPQMGTKHSFNISVSAGIVLWEAAKKLAAF